MTPDMENLVRASIQVRTIKETHALLQRTVLGAPSLHEIQHFSAAVRAGRKTGGVIRSQYDVAVMNTLSCDALLRRQLETKQVPSWPAMLEHWTRHGRPSVSEALAA
jgi:hypothetical protein